MEEETLLLVTDEDTVELELTYSEELALLELSFSLEELTSVLLEMISSLLLLIALEILEATLEERVLLPQPLNTRTRVARKIGSFLFFIGIHYIHIIKIKKDR